MRGTPPALLVSILLLSSGCYTVSFHDVDPVTGNDIPISAQIEIPDKTRKMTYDVRSAAAGGANRFRIPVGQTLAQYADAYLKPAFQAGDDVNIQINVESFHVKDFEAHIDAQFLVTRGSASVFDKRYHANGTGHFAQTAFGGAFAMKSSMRKTTDEAMRSLFEQFLADAKREYSGWMASAPQPPNRAVAVASPGR